MVALPLNSHMPDIKIMLECLRRLLDNLIIVVGIRLDEVHGKRVLSRTERPYMQMMGSFYTWQVNQSVTNLGRVNAPGYGINR